MAKRNQKSPYLKYFGIKSLVELLRKKILINFTHQLPGKESEEYEICCAITHYTFSFGNIFIAVPIIGTDGDGDICVLEVWPGELSTEMNFSLCIDSGSIEPKRERVKYQTDRTDAGNLKVSFL